MDFYGLKHSLFEKELSESTEQIFTFYFNFKNLQTILLEISLHKD